MVFILKQNNVSSDDDHDECILKYRGPSRPKWKRSRPSLVKPSVPTDPDDPEWILNSFLICIFNIFNMLLIYKLIYMM